MCAVFGVCTTFFHQDQGLKALQAMQQRLVRRGPDDQGQQLFRNHEYSLWLGHNRLAILGTSRTALQPQTSTDGRWTISFNGQVYNYRALASELKLPLSDDLTDTQVILASFEHWGLAALGRFDGMFALAIVDLELQQLWLVRDTMGIKPLFFYHDAGTKTLAFASQVTSLMHSGLFIPSLDQQSLASFLRFGTVLPPHTMIKQIQAVLPGALVGFDLNTLQSLPEQTIKLQAVSSEALTTTDFLYNLGQTVTPTLPTGIFLSGGIDSASIVGGLKQLGFDNLSAFSLKVTAESGCIDEAEIAARLAKKLGIPHFVLDCSEFKFSSGLFEEFIEALDQPSTDGLNTFLLSKFAAQQVKVALTGLGGDELFFGYRQMRQFAWAKEHPWRYRVLQPVLSKLDKFDCLKPLHRRFNVDYLPGIPDDGNLFLAALNARALFSVDELTSLNLSWLQESNSLSNTSFSPQQAELTAYTQPVLLADSDCLSMHSSLELRIPFLNPFFAKQVLQMSIQQLLEPNCWPSKPFLSELVKDFVPHKLLQARKSGFVLPLGTWLATALKSPIHGLLHSNFLPSSMLVAELAKVHQQPWLWRKFWGTLVLYHWLKHHRLI